MTLQFVSFTACTLRNGVKSTPNVLAQAGLTFPRSPTHTFTRQKRYVSRNFYVSNPIPDAAVPMRSANIKLQNRRRHRIIRYTQTRSNLDAAVPTQKQLYTCKTSNSISTKKQKSHWNLSSTVRQKVLSPRQSYPHRSRKRAYRFTILDLPSTLLPIKSMRSSQLLSPPLLFSLLFSAICCSLSQLFSTLLYSANSCLLRIYIYILLSTLLCSAHLTSSSPVVPLFNSFRLFAHRLTSSQLFLRPFSFSHLFSSLSKLLSTLPNFSTLLNSSPLLNSSLLLVFSGFSKGIML